MSAEGLLPSMPWLVSSCSRLSSLDLVVVVVRQVHLGGSAELEAAQPGQSFRCWCPCFRRHGFPVLVPNLRHPRDCVSFLGPYSPPWMMTYDDRARDLHGHVGTW